MPLSHLDSRAAQFGGDPLEFANLPHGTPAVSSQSACGRNGWSLLTQPRRLTVPNVPDTHGGIEV